jgi:hypothetical protein
MLISVTFYISWTKILLKTKWKKFILLVEHENCMGLISQKPKHYYFVRPSNTKHISLLYHLKKQLLILKMPLKNLNDIPWAHIIFVFKKWKMSSMRMSYLKY